MTKIQTKKFVVKFDTEVLRSFKNAKTITEDFVSTCIYQNIRPDIALLNEMASYLVKHQPLRVELITESELIRRCKVLGFKTTRGSVKLYRRRGLLEDEFGKWYFQNKEGSLRYDWKKMKPFLLARHNSPYSRLKK